MKKEHVEHLKHLAFQNQPDKGAKCNAHIIQKIISHAKTISAWLFLIKKHRSTKTLKKKFTSNLIATYCLKMLDGWEKLWIECWSTKTRKYSELKRKMHIQRRRENGPQAFLHNVENSTALQQQDKCLIIICFMDRNFLKAH